MLKTRHYPADIMRQYVARFAKLESMEAMKVADIPMEARDMIWSRKLLPVASTKNPDSPFGTAPIRDQDFSITWAICPPGPG